MYLTINCRWNINVSYKSVANSWNEKTSTPGYMKVRVSVSEWILAVHVFTQKHPSFKKKLLILGECYKT